ncbi:hypothetical protein GCM10027562_32960 [Arthrobacter pigmenti]
MPKAAPWFIGIVIGIAIVVALLLGSGVGQWMSLLIGIVLACIAGIVLMVRSKGSPHTAKEESEHDSKPGDGNSSIP